MTDYHGENLKRILKKYKITHEAFAEKWREGDSEKQGISRTYLQRMFKMSIFKSHYIDAAINTLMESFDVDIADRRGEYFPTNGNHSENQPSKVFNGNSSKTFNNSEILKIENEHLKEKIEWLEEKADFYKSENERLEEQIKTFMGQKTG